MGSGGANAPSKETCWVFVLYFMFLQTALLKAASTTVNKYRNIQGEGQEPACYKDMKICYF